MREILLRSGRVAVLSAIASVVIASLFAKGGGWIIEGHGLLLSILCPLLIAWPASAYTFWQKQRLSRALAEAETANDELEAAHAELGRIHALLEERARRDDMTGMLNRETFFQEMEKARAADEAGVLLIVDADNFKRINDTHGHLNGDDALLLICGAVEHILREGDIAGRIGGEEFAIYLVGAGAAEAARIAERIRAEVERLAFTPDEAQRVPLTVSIGGAANRREATLSQMMREADRRLYEAKRRGRNMVICEPDVSQAA